MSIVPTVKIKRLTGFCNINLSDFDESKHELYDESTTAEVEEDTQDVSDEPEGSVEATDEVTEGEESDDDIETNDLETDEGEEFHWVNEENTKDEIEDFALINYSLDLDKRNSKENMIKELVEYVASLPDKE